MRNIQRFALALLVLAGAETLQACDLCAAFAVSEAEGSNGEGFLAGYAAQFTAFNTLQSSGRRVANDGERLDGLTSQLFVGYNFNSRLGLRLNLPVIYREYSRNYTSVDDGHVYSPATRRLAGVGDVALLGSFRPYQYLTENVTFSWTAFGGLKLRSGGTSHLNPDESDFSTGIGGHDLALGSGSVDGLVGSFAFARWKRMFLSASMQYAIRTEGAYHYEFANDLTWFGGPGAYIVLEDTYTLAVQAVVSGETKGQDTIHGVPTDDTAETLVAIGPQVSFTWGRRFSAQLGEDLPLSIESTGNQLVPDYRIHGAITWRF